MTDANKRLDAIFERIKLVQSVAEQNREELAELQAEQERSRLEMAQIQTEMAQLRQLKDLVNQSQQEVNQND